MIKSSNFVRLMVFCSFALGLATDLFAQYSLEDFPGECANASDREPLPGHIVRLGFVANTSYGWSFLFPDRQTSKTLERVDIADNVGLIGQDPDEDFSDLILRRTPNNSFVVAQIFVGDESIEPVVTCVSRVIPLTRRFNPAYYGQGFDWLNRGTLVHWLKWRKYHKKWNWKKWWHKDFYNIRKNFHGFKKKDHRRLKNIRYDNGDRGRKFGKFNYYNKQKPIIRPKPKREEVTTQTQHSFGRHGIGRAGMFKRDENEQNITKPGFMNRTKKRDVDHPAFKRTSLPGQERSGRAMLGKEEKE